MVCETLDRAAVGTPEGIRDGSHPDRSFSALCVCGPFVWWFFDIDIADIVASSVTPAIGAGLIYWYDTPLASAGGLLLLAIGAFSLYYLVRRRARPRL